jgi:hypothetical protein
MRRRYRLPVPELTVIAVDWSGAKKTSLKSGIWLTAMQHGTVVHSEALPTREAAVARLCSFPVPVVAGFDFSFAFPAWFAREHGCTTVTDVWRLAARDGERWLRAQAPFWRDRCAVPEEQRFRACELRLRAAGYPAKSIFQLVGSGQVGPGSVRGMPLLAVLRIAGFAVWPFDAPGDRTVMEIYPSLLRKLVKHDGVRFSSPHERDATLSAAVMSGHRESFAALTAATDPVTLIEGDVWTPPGVLGV